MSTTSRFTYWRTKSYASHLSVYRAGEFVWRRRPGESEWSYVPTPRHTLLYAYDPIPEAEAFRLLGQPERPDTEAAEIMRELLDTLDMEMGDDTEGMKRAKAYLARFSPSPSSVEAAAGDEGEVPTSPESEVRRG